MSQHYCFVFVEPFRAKALNMAKKFDQIGKIVKHFFFFLIKILGKPLKPGYDLIHVPIEQFIVEEELAENLCFFVVLDLFG
jgi:hypothetical protein